MTYRAFVLAATAGLFVATLAGAQMTPAPAAPATPLPVTPGFRLTTPPGAVVTRPLPPSQWTTAQISQSFEFADSNGDGVLTRAEAQQLTIMPRGFEDMDENKDGVVSRAEYENSFKTRGMGKTATRHTSAEFVAFLTDIENQQGKEIHVIATTFGTRKHVEFWPQQVHMHFTTYSSWLNQVELWFEDRARCHRSGCSHRVT